MKELIKINKNLPIKLEDLTKFVLIGREKLVAVKAEIRAIDKIGLAKEVRENKLDEAQGLANALLDAEAKIGEILKKITEKHEATSGAGRSSLPQGITHKLSHYCQQLADNLDIIEKVKTEAEENDDLATRTEVLRQIKEKKRFSKSGVSPLPEGKYNIIYADPPWDYYYGGNKNQSLHYSPMPLEDICKLKVSELADDNCLLFMWVTFPMLDQFVDVLRCWGFEYSTVGFVWVKMNKKTNTPFIGLGSWTRSNAEICVIARRGHIERQDASVSQIVIAPIEKHSKKPDIVRDKIVQLVGKLPRIELFGRPTGHPSEEGWVFWGDQV